MTRLLFLLVLCFTNICFAAAKTNINKIDDMPSTGLDIEKQTEQVTELLKSKKSYDFLPGMDEADSTAATLNSIKPTDLDKVGRSKRTSKEYQFFDENELQPDYTKAGNRMHKKDAQDIADATGKALSGLMLKLKDLGIDCRIARGAVQKEPVYHIELQREAGRNTEYDQFFCEEPRNQYSCTNSLTLTCRQKGMKWEAWQDREIAIDGWTLYWYHNHWGYEIYWKRKRHGWHIGCGYPGEVRALIANRLGAKIEQIHETIGFPPSGRGIGNINSIGERWRLTWDNYVFRYKFREGSEICTDWAEEWREKCVLK